MRRDPTLLSLLLVTLTAPAAWAAPPADEGAWTLFAASRTRWVRDGSYDLLSGDDVLPVLEAGVALRLDGGLWMSLVYQGGGASADGILGGYALSLSRQGAALGLGYEHAVALPWLRPFVRAEAGVAFGRLGASWPDSAGEDVSGWATGAQGYAGAGVRLVPFHTMPAAKEGSDAPRPGGLSFGMDAELGYTLATSLDFGDLRAPEPTGDEDPEPISRRSLAMGEIDLSGLELRIGAFMRF